jgi:glycosyltransferase involved in cell wall biosynthesis
LVPPLQVALDATPLSVPSGGIRRYTAELACALAAQFPEDTYHLLSDQPFEMPSAGAAGQDGQAPNLRRGIGPHSKLDRRWWTVGLSLEMQRLGVDVFHGTDFATPYLPLRPSVMTVHDLSPWRCGSADQTSERVRRRTPFLLGLGLTTMVITPSEAVRRELLARFRVAPQRVVATPLAASKWFRPTPPAEPGRPYFLCVGASNPRKNLSVVQSAWQELRNKSDVDLMVAGAGEPIPDDALPALYSGAVALLYPSLYEGFGLPVLEAMQCGTMVIASKDPAVTEVAGGAAVQVEASDVRGWVAAMTAALSEEHRAAWRERGLARAAEFSWERTAVLTREVYDEARRLF